MRKGLYYIGLGLVVFVLSTAFRTQTVPETKSGELLVRFKDVSAVSSVLSRYNAQKLQTIDKLNMLHLRLKPEQDLQSVIAELNKNQNVHYAEPVYIYKATVSPDDPQFGNQWGFQNTGQDGGTAGADVRAVQAWDVTKGSRDVIVGVVDTGIDYTHEDLKDNIFVNPAEDAWADPHNPATGNGVDDDGNGYIDDWKGWNFKDETNNALDDNMHGTHCAGVIGASGNNNTGITGLNWNVQMMPLKFLDQMGYGNSADAVKAIIYAADMNVHVLSNSWGGTGFSQALMDAVRYALDKDVLFVAAAGNGGVDTDVTPEYPACYDVANVISVAASDHNDKRAIWGGGGGGDNCGIVCSSAYAALPGSNYGLSTVDLAAPGKEIYSAIPGNGYGNLTGTSMATPFVAGAAALVLAKKPDFIALEVKDRLLSTVDKLSAFDGLIKSGGRLNVAAALADD